ncbi:MULTISPECIES: diguanylate cyclase domain-containing protein [Gammaproteobacteria]|uniref:diguanylate cyclase domain-containing protein n=1 Tax=Gammaproteobacteria TaxID=1236 RepID=UPI000DD0A66C|nr:MULTISPECIES: diguanylate cyclase [Gammaproteobacteria]RTE86399.1 sensor domain-containing diguanylate cyclase [Aliidiomarina sp. B3213]TCZ91746.1 sensor domain-containing diguanylate cyclase [Lysobacter sp. N42]
MKKSITIYLAVPLMLLSIVGIEYAQSAYRDQLLSEERAERSLKFQLARAQLESIIFHDIYLSESLATYISANPNSDSEEWEPIARALYERADAIRNIGLAPDNIIRYVYPLEGNEEAIGFDFRTNPIQYASVRQAMESKEMVVSGPVNLVQGGTALIARVPIFEVNNPDRYWGGASVVINTDILFDEAGLTELADQGVRFALRGRHGRGRDGDIFYGEESIFEGGNPELVVNLPNGNWILAYEKLTAFSERIAWYREHLVRILGISLLFAILAILGYTDWALNLARKHAREDKLTGLTNLRYLDQFTELLMSKNAKERIQFAILYIDLDGFKQINDLYGHKVGDDMLIAVADTLRKSISSTDVAARIGGDEFLLLLTRMRSFKDLDFVVEKIRTAIVETTIEHNGKKLYVGASIGTATYSEEGKSLDDLLKTADKKMYENKRERKENES